MIDRSGDGASYVIMLLFTCKKVDFQPHAVAYDVDESKNTSTPSLSSQF